MKETVNILIVDDEAEEKLEKIFEPFFTTKEIGV